MATKAIDAPAKSRSTNTRRIRKIFGNIHEISEMPNLIEVQRESYEQFLRSDPSIGYVSGLEKTLRSVFPIQDFAGTAHLDFDRYELEPPKYDTDECRQRGLTYAAPMRVTLRLTSFEIDPDTEAKSVIDIKEQDVYMGDMPLMTMNGTFIINGTERVIVSQMHRSPGVLFDHDRGKTHSSGKYLFAARVIPYRGSWLDFEFDAKDIVNVRIDRKRKLPVTALLHALGMSSEEILNTFYNRIVYAKAKTGWRVPFDAERMKGFKATTDLVDGHAVAHELAEDARLANAAMERQVVVGSAFGDERDAVAVWAHREARDADRVATDDAALCEQIGLPVVIVRGSERAIKITEEIDFALAEALSIFRE